MIKPEYYQNGDGRDLFWHFANGLLTKDEYRGFLKGNIYKYTKRYQEKNGIEDLKKAETYITELYTFEENLEHSNAAVVNESCEICTHC